MTTQVRTFNLPQPLGERLAEASSLQTSCRPLSPQPELFRKPQELAKRTENSYKKFPMPTEYQNSGGGITFAAQDKLPKLPIPELTSTCKKYIEALKPLQTPRERSDTQHAVDDFLKNEGPELQEKLMQYAQGKTSYIEQFCEFSIDDE